MSASYTTKMFDRLDRICFSHYGTTKDGIVEFVIALNPGLEDQGILLPVGMTITLPDKPAAKKAETTTGTFRLW